MDIRRFGPGHRRPDGPPGTTGVTGQVIHQDARGTIAELAFGPRAMIAPHSNPNTTLFIVVSGGGFVQVGGERARISHGEAVMWPAGEMHGAWTEGIEMRALVVELAGPDDAWARGVVEAVSRRDPAALPVAERLERGVGSTVEPGRGDLVEPPVPPAEGGRDESSGEPW